MMRSDRHHVAQFDSLYWIGLCSGAIGLLMMCQMAWDVFRFAGGNYHAIGMATVSIIYAFYRVRTSLIAAAIFFLLSVMFLVINFPNFAAMRVFDVSATDQAQFYASRYTMYAFLLFSSLTYALLSGLVLFLALLARVRLEK